MVPSLAETGLLAKTCFSETRQRAAISFDIKSASVLEMSLPGVQP